MSGMKRNMVLALAVAAAVAAPGAFATNGYFSHGYGMKAKGMAGAGVAFPQDALAAATNPAGMVLVGNRMDIGMDLFRPIRDTSVTGNLSSANNLDYDASEKKNFFVPEFGYNRMMSNTMSFGVSVYGNGGMNTSYTRNITLFGTTNAGVDLAQLIVAPTFAWKLSDANAVGISLNLAYQRFKATGLENFDNTTYSNSPGNVHGNGYSSSTGAGVRVGWTGTVSPTVTVGATYQTETQMSEFDKYKGLFAENGDFDIPANVAVGLAVKANPKTMVVLDVEKIFYKDVKAVSNPLVPNLTSSKLGLSDGAGFGWKDQTVVKLGVSHEYSKDLTLRGGLNHGKSPIPNAETFFNLLAPATVENHLTLGATWKMSKDSEFTAAYMHAFSKKINGSGSIPSGFGSGEANLKMDQNSFGVAYSWNM